MKKLLSLSLAIVMLLSCMLFQTVAVSAAGAVDYTDAPYAGVYAVTSNVATTVTTEAGSVTELAAGVTGYTFLVKGANQVQVSNGANLTITALEDNGKAYYDQVTIPNVLITGTSDTHDVTSATTITLASGESRTLTHTANHGAGIYYPYLSGTEGGTIRVTSDTGFYADILLRGGSSSAWADGSNKGDPEIVYLKAGEQTITLTNIGSSTVNVDTTRFGTTFPFISNDLWLGQMAMKELKVVPYVAEPEPTPDVPTEETITYTAPYAGVYQVTSDKDVTLTNETGHTVTLVAGATDYFYLIQGNNNITTTDASATLTFTTLEGNGLDYISEVTMTEEPILPGDTGDAITGFANVTLAPGEKFTATYTPGVITAGLVYPYIAPAVGAGNTVRVTTDTGYYADIYLDYNYSSSAWADAARQHPEMLYVRDGEQAITIENIGSSTVTFYAVKICTTGVLAEADYWKDQMNMASLKVVPFVAEPDPTPTPDAPSSGTASYTADLAGVYEVSSDKAVTVTTEIGSIATLEAGETGYIYLLKGANILGISDADANLTITALENNGLDYLDQVTAEIPLASSSLSELTLSGNYTNPQGSYNDYGATTGVALGKNGSVDVTVTAPAAGLYVTQIQFATDAQAHVSVASDTGFYGVINQQAGRVGWNELYQGEHGVGNQDMEIIFLREGANTITLKNIGDGDTLITKIKMAKTGSLASLEAYNWQLNLENLKVVAPVIDSFINDVVDAIVAGTTVTLSGRIGAEWMNELYGVEFTTNKTGTRAQKYYGARPGDIVGDYNGSTEFTFGEWDGTFEIILEGVSAGLKEYKFFVGDNYTDAATFEVAAAE